MNPVQWAATTLDESTPCDLIVLMALRDLTDVSKMSKNTKITIFKTF